MCSVRGELELLGFLLHLYATATNLLPLEMLAAGLADSRNWSTADGITEVTPEYKATTEVTREINQNATFYECGYQGRCLQETVTGRRKGMARAESLLTAM